jgi:hypothetical protein
LKKQTTALRSLRSLIHPDRQADNCETATKRFQDVQIFYDNCVANLDRKERPVIRERPTSIHVRFPVEFNIFNKWKFLSECGDQPILPEGSLLDQSMYARSIGFKCFNLRGSMAHGRRPELFYGFETFVRSGEARSILDLFEEYGGASSLDSIESIKKEIIEQGPVVSTLFRLTEEFYNACEFSASFAPSLVGDTHPVLIVGWQLTSVGEMWLIRTARGNYDIPIGFRQFGIEDEVFSPMKDFSRTPWQDGSKAIEISFGSEDWYSWSKIDMTMTSGELEKLCKILGCGLSEAFRNEGCFVVRDRVKKAQSRWATLTEVSWIDSKKHWRVSADFGDKRLRLLSESEPVSDQIDDDESDGRYIPKCFP